MTRDTGKINWTNSTLQRFEQEQFDRLVEEYNDVFFSESGLPGRYNGPLEARIELKKGTQPTQVKGGRVPIAYQDESRRQLEQMLKHRIIEPSDSPFCSPLLMVPKKSGELRIVIDFRQLNLSNKA